MKFHLNPDLIITAVRTSLLSDSALFDATLLGATGKIYTGSLPTDYKSPCLLVTTQSFLQLASEFTGEIRIFHYRGLLSNGQIDPKADAVVAEVEKYLIENEFVITDMSVVSVSSLGNVPSFFDGETDRTKSRGVCRLNAVIGYTSEI